MLRSPPGAGPVAASTQRAKAGRSAGGTGSRRAAGRAAAARRGSRPARRRRADRAWPRRAGACRDAAARGRARRPARARRSRPAYMTAARSQSCATTGRSCVTSTSASPKSRQSASSSSRICACTITSSAVVGSSAMQHARACRRAPSRSRRAGACRRRTRAGSASARSAGMPTELEQLAGARCAARPAARAVQLERLDDLRADRLHRVERVHRALEHHRDVGPAVRADRRPRRRRGCPSPSSSDAARHGRARRQQPHQREHGRRLAAARLADQPEPLAARRARSTRPGPRAAPAARQVEPDVQILELEQGAHSASASGRRAGRSRKAARRQVAPAGAG